MNLKDYEESRERAISEIKIAIEDKNLINIIYWSKSIIFWQERFEELQKLIEEESHN